MNTFLALNPASRRALRIPYESPFICQLGEISSGSGSTAVSVLEILPTERAAGPVLSAELLEDGAVQLSWTNNVPNAYAYVIYRATVVDGPYSAQASGVLDRIFIDFPPGSGTFYYKVTSLEPNFGETFASNIVSVSVP